MTKRNLSVLLVLLLMAFVAWYMNQPAGPQAPAQTKSALANSQNLPCRESNDKVKKFEGSPVIPMLKEKGLPVYKVLEVIDGDTITVVKSGQTTQIKVRLLGMDTPEKSTTRTGSAEYYGEESYRYALSLIEKSGMEVRLTFDTVEKDQYGRTLAYVWLKDGRMLNAVMVADGYAMTYASSPKPEYLDTFRTLAKEAREQEKGLWGVCK